MDVQAQGENLTLELSLPYEGETFYAGPSSLIYLVPIAGTVKSESFEPDQIRILIEVFQNNDLILSVSEFPDQEGEFRVFATVNPGVDVATRELTADFFSCADKCHYDSAFPFQGGAPVSIFNFPAGPIKLIVTATDPSGEETSLERNIIVDRSDYAIVPIQVVMEGDTEVSLENIPVAGTTWLYMWRARSTINVTDSNGLIHMKVEALSQETTTYHFNVPPTVVDGILYEGTASEVVVLSPGATSSPLITIPVKASFGILNGKVSGDLPSVQTHIWAIAESGETHIAHIIARWLFSF